MSTLAALTVAVALALVAVAMLVLFLALTGESPGAAKGE